MADRFYVGGTSTWNTTGSWSTSSGGSSGASVPTSSDNAIFDTGSGNPFQCSVDTNASCNNLDLSAVVGNGSLVLFTNSATTLTINGNLALGNRSGGGSMFVGGSSPGTIILAGTGTITFNNANNNSGAAMTISGVYGLGDDFLFVKNTALQITGGTFTTNNHNILTAAFKTTGSPTLNLGTSVITIGEKGTILSLSSTSTVNGSSASFQHRSAGGVNVNDSNFPTKIDLQGATIGFLSFSYLVGFNDTYTNSQYMQFKTSGTIGQLDVPQGVFMKGIAGQTLTMTNCNIVGTVSLPCSLQSETAGVAFNICPTNSNIIQLLVKDIVSCVPITDQGPTSNCGTGLTNITCAPAPAIAASGAAILTML